VRIVLMGTGPFAVPSFEAIRASGMHDISLVVTKPIQNSDIKSKVMANPVRAWADLHNLPLFDPPTINSQDSIAVVNEHASDLLVVCDYGQILSASALCSAKLGGINLHGSLLPRHRGAAPVQWSILRGDNKTGACVIHMTPKLDGGPVIAQVATDIIETETAGELEKRLSELGVECCMQAIVLLSKCKTLDACEGLGERQDNAVATPAPRLSKADGVLDFRYSAVIIDRQVRGLMPWPGNFGNIHVGTDKVLRTILSQVRRTGWRVDPTISTETKNQETLKTRKTTRGTLLWGHQLDDVISAQSTSSGNVVGQRSRLVVACDDEWLEIQKLQPSGKKIMDSREFLAGYGRSESMCFEVPSDDAPRHELLEKMRKSR